MPNTINGTTTIEDVVAREILDSRGSPTIEVEVLLMGGERGVAAVASGPSKGGPEEVAVRGGDKRRDGGKGAVQAGGDGEKIIRDATLGRYAPEPDMSDEGVFG